MSDQPSEKSDQHRQRQTRRNGEHAEGASAEGHQAVSVVEAGFSAMNRLI